MNLVGVVITVFMKIFRSAYPSIPSTFYLSRLNVVLIVKKFTFQEDEGGDAYVDEIVFS